MTRRSRPKGAPFGMHRLLVSFSGGRTSAYMLHRLLKDPPPNTKIVTTFANTGQEHEDTLRFVDAVDKAFSANIVWLEAAVDPRDGVGTSYRIVNYERASRKGEPFEDVIRKYGLPNQAYRGICTRELKMRPIHAYARSIGWPTGTYETAIGIRADEADRMSARADVDGLSYPLVRWGVTKADVLAFWKDQPFDLGIPEHLGNCVWCWKKSLRKHLTLAKDHPEVFEFPARVEKLYAHAGAGVGPRRIFRGNRTTEDIFKLAELPFEPFVPSQDPQLPLADIDMPTGGCSESCEVHMEDAE